MDAPVPPPADGGDSGKGSGKCGGKKAEKGGRRSFDGGGPVPVVVAKVTQKDVPIEVSVVGNVEAYATITMIPQVGGAVDRSIFTEGDTSRRARSCSDRSAPAASARSQQNHSELWRATRPCWARRKPIWRATSPRKNTPAPKRERYGKLFDEGIVSSEQGDQYLTNADTLAQSVRPTGRRSKARRRRSRRTKRHRQRQSAAQLHHHPFADRRENRQFDGEAGQRGLGELTPTWITITQVEPIYVTFAVPEANLPISKATWRRANCR